MNRKGMYFIGIVLGAIVILLIVYGIGNVGYQFAKQKIFGEKGVLGTPVPEEKFMPGAIQLSDEELKVVNSANALRCALNSVAVGEFKPDDPTVCPMPLAPGSTIINLAKALTGKAAAPVANAMTKSYYTSEVQCQGIPVSRVALKDKDSEEDVMRTIVNEMLKCNAKPAYIDSRCSYIDFSRLSKRVSFDEDSIINYMAKNKAQFPGFEKAVDDLLSSANTAWQNHIEIETTFNKGKISSNPDEIFCIDYRHGTVLNYYISINDCDLQASETFSCSVKDFQLPQDISLANQYIAAYGDPRWLIYYESLPPEAAEYWHKQWSDIFNVWTIATVTGSGMLNMLGGAGKGAKAVQTAAKKEAANLAKEGAESLVKKGITEAEKVVIERLAKNGVENTMKTFVVEESLQEVKGLGKEGAAEVSEAVLKKIGTNSGPRAWTKALEQGLEKDVGDVIEKRVTDVPDAFVTAWKQNPKTPITELIGANQLPLPDAEIRAKALQAYKDSIKKAIVEGTELPEEAVEQGAKKTMQFAGTEVKGGLKELVEKDLSKEMGSNILRKRAYEKLMSDLIRQDGTLNLDLLKNNAQAALKSLDAMGTISTTNMQRVLAGTRDVMDIFLAGTFGGYNTKNLPKNWKDIFKFIEAQSPIKFSTRGFVIGGSVLKSAASLPQWVASHQYPVMLLLSFYLDAVDSQNEKFKPVGSNAIAVNQPTFEGPTTPLDLNDAAGDLFVHNKDLYGRRMYFASPCKANLQVYRRKCTCYKNPQMHKFTYPSGMINVEPGSVKPLSGAVLEAKFKAKWDSVAKAQTPPDKWRKQWDALDASSQSLYGNSYDQYALAQYIDEQQEKYNSNFFSDVISPVGGLVKGRDGFINWLAGTTQIQTGLSARDYSSRMKENYDASLALKRCDQSGTMKEIANVGGALYYSYASGGNIWGASMSSEAQQKLKEVLLYDEFFKPDCLEIEAQRLDGTYCYDHFPQTEWIRNAVTVASLVVDGVVITATGGLGTPVALLATGVLSASVDVLLETAEKWP